MSAIEIEHDPQPSDDERKRGAAQDLIAIGAGHHLFADPDGTAYARLAINGHHEVLAVESGAYRDLLAAEYFRQFERGANRNAIGDAIATLAAKAKYCGGERLPVALRVGSSGGALYVDSGDSSWTAWRVDSHRVTRDPEPACLFRRSAKSIPLPEPDGSDLSPLWDLIPCRVDQQPLIAAFMVGALRSRGPYPVLLLTSEQGSGKSSTTRTLKALTDPSTVPLRSPPREERDLQVAAINSHVIAYDNLSGCPPWLSDGICRLATGGGIAARTLYTDTAETLLHVERSVILNGIDDLASRPDLAERALLIELESIQTRRTEHDLRRMLDRSAGAIFGAILDGLRLAMRDARSIDIGPLPRMADFACWAAAAMPALGFTADQFLRAYRASVRNATMGAIESSPIAAGLIDLSERHPNGWQGTVGELLRVLNPDRDRSFPATPEKLGNALRRLAPAFRQAGVSVTIGERSRHGRLVTVQRLKTPAQPTPTDTPIHNGRDGCAGRDGCDGQFEACADPDEPWS